MKKILLASVLLILGFAFGVAVTITAYWYIHQETSVYTVKERVNTAEGIILPQGTQLIHDGAMKEGFDRLKLYINVEGETLNTKFTKHIEKKAFLIIPYWVQEL